MSPESQGGYLEAGDWDLTVGYRHQFSYKHFVGDVEQTYRVQQGTQVMNKINLEDINLTYQATSRISVTLTVPILFASRRSNNSLLHHHSAGLGDMRGSGAGLALESAARQTRQHQHRFRRAGADRQGQRAEQRSDLGHRDHADRDHG